MFPASSRFIRQSILSVLPVRPATACVLLLSLAGGAASLRAATAAEEQGVRLLKAELPSGAKIPEVSCEVLARAVGKATVAHRAEAPDILSAALNGGVDKEMRKNSEKLPCSCVSRVVRASLTAAPAQASSVFDAAVAAYPECADELAALLDLVTKANYNYKDPADAPVAGINNLSGVIGSGLSGFGAGLGPGFPGSPGFSGSSPSGGLALPNAMPTPQPTPVTTVMNG